MVRGFPGNFSLVLAILLATATSRADAQEPAGSDGPAPLLPESAPAVLVPPPPTLPGEQAEAGANADQQKSGIEIGELAALDPDSGGILDASVGGLGIDMWIGSERRRLLLLLPQLPAGYESPTLHDLARRLLLSAAIAPKRGEDDPPDSLIGLRIERLAAMGLAGAVAEMMSVAPSPETDGVLMRLIVDNRLLLNDNAGACASAAAGEKVLDPLYRDRVAVFCSVLAGDMESAGVSANLLRDGGEIEDPAFFTLADALTAGLRPRFDSLTEPAPIHLAMAMTAKVKLPSDVLETGSPLMLRALADSPLVSGSVRLAAAERAARAGAYDPGSLTERYAALELSGKELDNALSIAEREYSPRNRALLYQAGKRQNLPVARAAAILKTWELARLDGSYPLSVAIYQAELETLKPSPELAWFAAAASRALFLLDQTDRALAWAAAARRFAKEPEEKLAAALLWPLIALSEGSATGPGHGRWLTALAEVNAVEANMRAGLAYSLFEAMGERIPEHRWSVLLQGGARADVLAPGPAYMRTFREAANAGRRGETALLALVLLGGDGLDESAPELLSEVVIGLRKVGLENEARRLAIEAVLAAGL